MSPGTDGFKLLAADEPPAVLETGRGGQEDELAG